MKGRPVINRYGRMDAEGNSIADGWFEGAVCRSIVGSPAMGMNGELAFPAGSRTRIGCVRCLRT